MGGRSSFPREFSEVRRAFGRSRLPVAGNRSNYHLVVETLSGQPSPGAGTGWRISVEQRSISTSGVFRCRAQEWPLAPQLVSLPPHAMIWLPNTRPTASGLPLVPPAVEFMVSGSAMQMVPTPWNCFHRRARVAGTPAGLPMDNALPSILMQREHGYLYHSGEWRKADPSDHRFGGRCGPELVERWQVGLLYIETNRSRRGVEGIGRRRGGCPGDQEWRRDGFRVT
jgi:hypothetical protein